MANSVSKKFDLDKKLDPLNEKVKLLFNLFNGSEFQKAIERFGYKFGE